MDLHLPYLLVYLFGICLIVATRATIVQGSTLGWFNDSLAENRQKYEPRIKCTNKLKKYPCYKTYGLRVGCYRGNCFRQKQRAWKRWGYFDKWKSEGRESCNSHQECIDILKEKPEDLPCYEGGKLEKYPCHRGWRYGCYSKKCFRQKFMTSSRWGYFEDRTSKENVPCKKHDECLHYWLERPNEMPCVKSIAWGSYPCYKGRRYGCGSAQGSQGMRKCWVEDPATYAMWSYVTYERQGVKMKNQLGDECDKGEHEDCTKIASKKIDSFKEP